MTSTHLAPRGHENLFSPLVMSVPSVEELYEHYEVLTSETSTLEEKELSYRTILLGTKGGDKEKRLACQFVAKFSKLFEQLKEESFNSMLDLCDDENCAIRKQAIHDLLNFSKRIPSFIPRVADVLVQMFQTDETSELNLLSISLSQLLQLEPKAALAGIFNQLLTINPDSSRENVLKFLIDRLKTIPDNKMTTEVEDFIVEQANKVLRDVSEEEFPLLIGIVSSLRCMSTVTGRQKLVIMITEQALQACPEFNPTDPACVAQIRESGKQVLLCISKNVHAREFYAYLLSKVLPKFVDIPDSLSEDCLALLRVTAELAIAQGYDQSGPHNSNADDYIESAFNALVHFLPELPQQDLKPEDSDGITKAEEKCSSKGMCSRLPELECLLCICCELGKTCPHFFGGYTTEQERETPLVQMGVARLRLARPRLQYLSRISQGYAQCLASNITRDGKIEETKSKVDSHRLATNIQVLVRSFFHNPPSFKHTVVLSWMQQPAPISSPPGSKRVGSSESALNGTKSRREQPRYKPPAGQWSRSNQSQRKATTSFQQSKRDLKSQKW